MFGFFRAIGRLIATLWYKATGQTDKVTKIMMKDPDVIRATMDQLVRETKGNAKELMDAIAALIANQEKKRGELERVEKAAARYGKIVAGAKAAMIRRKTKLEGEGKTRDQIVVDPEFVKHNDAYKNAKSTLAEKTERIGSLQGAITQDQQRIDKHKRTLTKVKGKIDELKKKSADYVARVISAEEERRINEMTAGLTINSTADAEARIDDVVREAEAAARVSSELAGTDAEAAADEYLAFAEDSAVDAELEAELWGAEEAETAAPATDDGLSEYEKAGEALDA